MGSSASAGVSVSTSRSPSGARSRRRDPLRGRPRAVAGGLRGHPAREGVAQLDGAQLDVGEAVHGRAAGGDEARPGVQPRHQLGGLAHDGQGAEAVQRALEGLAQALRAGRGAHPRRHGDEQHRAQHALQRQLQAGAAEQPAGQRGEREQRRPAPARAARRRGRAARAATPGTSQAVTPSSSGHDGARQQQPGREQRREHDGARIEAAGRGRRAAAAAARRSGVGRRGRRPRRRALAGTRPPAPCCRRSPRAIWQAAVTASAPAAPCGSDPQPARELLVGAGELVQPAEDHEDERARAATA